MNRFVPLWEPPPLAAERAVCGEVAGGGVRRRVSADEIRDDIQPTPCAKHFFDEPLHRGAIAGNGGSDQYPWIIRRTGQVTKRVAQSGAVVFVPDRYRHMRALPKIGAQDRRADVSCRARKYYDTLRKIEHRG
jgi:hypothetical protein